MKNTLILALGLFIGLLSQSAMAVENASWGDVKAQMEQEPAGKLVVTKTKAGGLGGSKEIKKEYQGVTIMVSADNPTPRFYHPGEEYTIKYTISSATEDVRMFMFSPVLDTPGMTGGYAVDRVSFFGLGYRFIATAFPGQNGTSTIPIPFFIPSPLDISAYNSFDLYLGFGITESCPVGTQVAFTLFSSPDFISIKGKDGKKISSLQNIFGGIPWLEVSGTVVPKGCVSEKGYSLETGEPCGHI